jgi:hypothetical protein
MDEDIKKLGELEFEDGHIKFYQFLKIYDIV